MASAITRAPHHPYPRLYTNGALNWPDEDFAVLRVAGVRTAHDGGNDLIGHFVAGYYFDASFLHILDEVLDDAVRRPSGVACLLAPEAPHIRYSHTGKVVNFFERVISFL